MARPTLLTTDLANRILQQLEAGKSLREICAADDMPSRATVTSWIAGNKMGFASHYALAKEIGLDQIAEECLEIADAPLMGEEVITKADGGVEVRKSDMLGHRKLQIDTRLKLLAKLAPKKYGDLQQIEHSGGVDMVAILTAARRRAGLVTAADDVQGSVIAGPGEQGLEPQQIEHTGPVDVVAILTAARRRSGIAADDTCDLA